MTALRQRQPRVEDPAYLAWVRTLPCLVTGKPGPSDPAHIRSASLAHGKRQTGMAEKPDDRWALPLCREMHDEQHSMNELAWWASKGIADPFAIAVSLYASRPGASRPERRKRAKTYVRKPKPSRKIPQRAKPWPEGRKLVTRPMRRGA